MNLKEFTESVDQSVEKLSKEELCCFIHSITRKVPDKERSEFLQILDEIGAVYNLCPDQKSLKAVKKLVDEKEVQVEFNRLTELFSQIEEEELYLQAEYYEDYSQGDWSDDGDWEYEDPNGICQIYEQGYQFLLRCVIDGFYMEASDMFDLLLDTEVMVENDGDSFTMGLEELTGNGLVSINLTNLALHTLYAVYQTCPKEERARRLYVYFEVHFFENIRIEDMLSLGREELGELPEFWDAWIELLCNAAGDKEARLLKEAVNFQRGEDKMLDVARIAYEKHPSLYLEVLMGLERLHDYERQLLVGKEALEKIDKKYILRSEISLKTAESAIWMGEEDYVEDCWMLALESNTTPVNFLRIMAESGEPQRYRDAAVKIIRFAKHGGNARNGFSKELKENCVSERERDILWFLCGNFNESMEKCRAEKQALGWSGRFIKCGIALFLLLLFKEDNLKQGCMQMADKVILEMDFKASVYYSGTKFYNEYRNDELTGSKKRDVFWKCFCRWKKGYCLSEEQMEKYLEYLEQMIDKRVKGIVSGQFRAHYEEVAALAAALGEVKESIGDANAKQTVLNQYKSAFPRHSSFHAALRKYGMTDMRSNR